MSLKNPFFVVISQSLAAAAEGEGYEVITMDADSDVKRQANQIEDFISQGVAAIVLNPTDRLAIGPAIKQANEAGIPVFTCDLQCVAEGIEIAGHIGTDNFQGGELAGQAMIEVYSRKTTHLQSTNQIRMLHPPIEQRQVLESKVKERQ